MIETKNITHTNSLIKASGVWVADQLALRKYEGRKRKNPWWKRPVEKDIKELDINILERIKKGKIGARKEGKAKLIEKSSESKEKV